MKDFKTAFFFLKLPIAISLLGHGLVRIPKLHTFSEWMVTTMEKSMIPKLVIVLFGYVLPIFEAILGILLLINFKTKYTLYSALVLMSILIFGSCSIENWSAIEAQLLHSFYLFGLFWFYEKFKTEESSL
ncbi:MULTISPECIES: MauE/DoxX family redox-associated membrane protein [Chryseobacterium]|uniref:MauE/DoxX family redox-associated membrane protein n=1 Tax=Chryseobacterium TaxID=59732 RepID=UPI000C9E2A61|nr:MULTISPECIES: MauE/DoxX family redox-associated membrane protein [Chryseobacterium]VXB37672.1 Thiosulfate dehydrogenase (quinone) large subunit [Chryseobacterium sp. 8AT]